MHNWEISCKKQHVQLPIKLFWFVHSLVPGWPKEGDLPHRQQGAVLRPSRDTSGVSNPALRARRHHLISKSRRGWYSCSCFCCSPHDRKKPLLFYFNILKCASPLVLLELQCPTTQVRVLLVQAHVLFWSLILIVAFLSMFFFSSCAWSVALTGTSPWWKPRWAARRTMTTTGSTARKAWTLPNW